MDRNSHITEILILGALGHKPVSFTPRLWGRPWADSLNSRDAVLVEEMDIETNNRADAYLTRNRDKAWEGKKQGVMSESKTGPGLDCLSPFLLVSLLFVQTYERYFIHYFVPGGLSPVKRNVVFVIDVSSSMFGTTMKQITRTLQTFHSSCFRRLRKQSVRERWSLGLETLPPITLGSYRPRLTLVSWYLAPQDPCRPETTER